MDNFFSLRNVSLMYGIPFEKMGFHEIMPAFNDLLYSGNSHCILAVTSEYVIRTYKNPLASFDFCDLYIPCDTDLLGLLKLYDQDLILPVRYEDFAEQIVRICFHNGYTLYNISTTPLSLEWMENPEKLLIQKDLFTNFRIENHFLESEDRTTILHSISQHRPNVILLCANFDVIADISPEIMEHSRDSLLVCIPVKPDYGPLEFLKKKLDIKALISSEKKIRNIFKDEDISLLPSNMSFSGRGGESRMLISGAVDKRMTQSLKQVGKKAIKRQTNIEIDMTKSIDISYEGLEGLLELASQLKIIRKKISLLNASEQIIQKIYATGINSYFNGLEGIPET